MGSEPGTILNETKYQIIHKYRRNTTSYSTYGIKANAPIRIEQDADLLLKNLKLNILGQPHDA